MCTLSADFHDLGVSYHGVFSSTSANVKVLRHLPLGHHDCVYLLVLRLLVGAEKKCFKPGVVSMPSQSAEAL